MMWSSVLTKSSHATASSVCCATSSQPTYYVGRNNADIEAKLQI